jgi:4-hydroxy-tetrahydrodipicolinate synthase
MVSAYASGNVNEAAKIHQQLFPLFKALFISVNPVPVKEALALLGLPAGPVRLPLVGLNSSQKEILVNAMRQAGLLLAG